MEREKLKKWLVLYLLNASFCVLGTLRQKCPVSSKKHESGAIERAGLEMQVSIEVATEATTMDDNTQRKTVESVDKQPEESRIFRGGEGPRKERKWTMGSKKKALSCPLPFPIGTNVPAKF